MILIHIINTLVWVNIIHLYYGQVVGMVFIKGLY